MSRMWFVCAFICLLTSLTTCSDTATQYFFCADMNPQQHINIEQLMGMWYGIEILTHNSDEHYIRIGNSCPILHLSDDKDYPVSTYSPLYTNYNYGYNYGERRLPATRPTNRPDPNRPIEYDQYGRPVQYPPYHRNYNSRRYGTRNYDPKNHNMKRLRIWWDENGTGIEYHLKYNSSRPGFWISAGPQNGSELEPQYSDFAGTVQVIKAVGNHLVLTFCHRLPERQLFTILLSRENKLAQYDIHSVHTLLNRKGLSANAIKKVCWNGSAKVELALKTLFISFMSFLLTHS